MSDRFTQPQHECICAPDPDGPVSEGCPLHDVVTIYHSPPTRLTRAELVEGLADLKILEVDRLIAKSDRWMISGSIVLAAGVLGSAYVRSWIPVTAGVGAAFALLVISIALLHLAKGPLDKAAILNAEVRDLLEAADAPR